MKKTTVIALMLAALLVVPTAAFAQTDDSTGDDSQASAEFHGEFDGAKRHVLTSIDRRIAALQEATSRVASAPHLTAAHAATLTADYAFHIDGLSALRVEVEATTTPGALHTLAEQVVHEHWVFALQIPKGRLTNGADIIADSSTEAFAIADEFGDALAELEALGINVEDGWVLLEELRGHIGTAQSLVESIPDTVLSIQVTEMPGAHSVLEAAREDIHEAHDSMIEARDTARELRDFIRSVIDV